MVYRNAMVQTLTRPSHDALNSRRQCRSQQPWRHGGILVGWMAAGSQDMKFTIESGTYT